ATPAPWSVAVAVAHAPGPVIGSTAWAIVGSPAPELTVCARVVEKSTSPGCRSAQVAAVKGPPEAAVLGQVWVSAVTDGAGRTSEPEPDLTNVSKNPWMCWASTAASAGLFWPRWCPPS